MDFRSEMMNKEKKFLLAAISLIPSVLFLLGFDFGLEHAEHEQHNERGHLLHLVLEWTGVCVAAMVAVLTYHQYKLSGNVASPIIGIALLVAALFDALHILVATGLVPAPENNQNFIPFTYALSRLMFAIVLIGAVRVIGFRRKQYYSEQERHKFLRKVYISFTLSSILIISLCAYVFKLPRTTYPEFIIVRPFDLAPLLLFFLIGIYFIPKLFKREKHVFIHTVAWSMLPAILSQLHMAFGSTQLFDSHFNIAHVLKVLSYLFPLIGLVIDYSMVYRKKAGQILRMQQAMESLRQKKKELNDFAYVSSHDLKEPITTIKTFVELIEQRYLDEKDEEAKQFFRFINLGTERMSALVHDMLSYTQIGRASTPQHLSLRKTFDEVLDEMSGLIDEHQVEISVGRLPNIYGYPEEIKTLFKELMFNSIKFKKPYESPKIAVEVESGDAFWKVKVKDNGIGMEPKYYEKAFALFQQLHKRNEYEGTGVGLALCKKIMDQHGGRIWIESELDLGTSVYLRIPNSKDQMVLN